MGSSRPVGHAVNAGAALRLICQGRQDELTVHSANRRFDGTPWGSAPRPPFHSAARRANRPDLEPTESSRSLLER